MTDIQIRYFLTAAKCLNFTEAARQLYISQPALSQQIAALERELNMQLFVRIKKRLYLTPAAKILLKELPKYELHYTSIIEKAKQANEGHTQTLSIGILNGQVVPTELLQRIFHFRKKYPQVSLEVISCSISEMEKLLMDDSIDLAVNFNFEISNKHNLDYIEIGENHGVAIVSKYHPVARKHITSLYELRHETFIMLNQMESSTLYDLIMNDCAREGFTPNIRFVSSLDENILYTELGLGIGISNRHSYACYNPNIITLDDLHIATNQFVLAWKRENMNPAISLFIESTN